MSSQDDFTKRCSAAGSAEKELGAGAAGVVGSLEGELLLGSILSVFDVNSVSPTHCRLAVGGMISCVCFLPCSLRTRWLIGQTSEEAVGRVPKQQVRRTGRRSVWWMCLEVTHALVDYSLGIGSP